MILDDSSNSNNLNPATARRRVKSTKSTRHRRHTSSIKARKELKRLRSRKKFHTLTIDCIGILNIQHSNVKKKRTFRKSGDSYYVILCRLPETTNLNKNEPSYAKKKRADSLEPALLIFPGEKKGKKFIEVTKKDSVYSERFQTRLCEFAVGLVILTEECVVARSVDIGIALLKQKEEDERMLPVEKLRDLLICDERQECQFQVMFKKSAHVFVAKDELVCNKWFKNIKESLLLRREEISTDRKEISDSDENSTGDVLDLSRKDWLKQARLDKESRMKRSPRSQVIFKTSKSQIIKRKKPSTPKPTLGRFMSTPKITSTRPASSTTLSLPMKDRKDDGKFSDTSDSICWERSFSSRVVEALTHMLAINSRRRNVKQHHTLTLQQLKKMIETKKHQAEEFLDRGDKESKLEYTIASSQNVLPFSPNIELELSEVSQNPAQDAEVIQRPSMEILRVHDNDKLIKNPETSPGLQPSIKCIGIDADQMTKSRDTKLGDEITLDLSSKNTSPKAYDSAEEYKLAQSVSPSVASLSVPRQKNRLRSYTWAKSNSNKGPLRDEIECQMVQLKIYPVPTEYDGKFFENLTEMLFQYNLIGGSTRIVVSKNGNCRFYVRRKAVGDGTILLFQDQLHDQWKHLHCIVDRSKTKVKKLADFIDGPSQTQNPADTKRSVKGSCGQIDGSMIASSDDEIDPSSRRIVPRRYSLRTTEDEHTTVQVIGNGYKTLTMHHNSQLGHLTQKLDDLVQDWEETHHFCSSTDSDGPIYLNDQIPTMVVALYSNRSRITVLTLPRNRPRIASTIFQFENDYSNWENQTLKAIFFDEWRTEDKIRKQFCESYLINFFRLFILSKPYELRIFASFYLNLHPIFLEALTPKLSSLLEETLKSSSTPEDIKERLHTYHKHLVGGTIIS